MLLLKWLLIVPWIAALNRLALLLGHTSCDQRFDTPLPPLHCSTSANETAQISKIFSSAIAAAGTVAAAIEFAASSPTVCKGVHQVHRHISSVFAFSLSFFITTRGDSHCFLHWSTSNGTD